MGTIPFHMKLQFYYKIQNDTVDDRIGKNLGDKYLL